MPRLLAALALVCAFARPAFASASLVRIGGIVEVRRSGSESWDVHVATAPRRFNQGDSVRTGSGASAAIALENGSIIAIGGSSEAQLTGSTARPIVLLQRGGLRAVFGKQPGALRVALPSGEVSPRAPSTVARVELSASGRTVVEVAQGAAVVEDARGAQLVVHAGERVRLDLRGAGQTEEAPRESDLDHERWKQRARREYALDRAREGTMSAAAREGRMTELLAGRVLMDSEGRRLRVERFVTRPTADSFRLVTLSTRRDRFDGFSLTATFDLPLPGDLSSTFRSLAGSVDAAPERVMTDYATLRTNGQDAVREFAEGGHAVDLNANADPADDVTSLYDPGAGVNRDTTGRAVFKTLFDRYGLYVNGNLKRGWSGVNVASYDPLEAVPSAASGTDPLTGAPAVVSAVTSNTTFPEPSLHRKVVYESYADGSFLEWDFRSTEFDGAFAPRSADYQLGTLPYDLELKIRASEFGGRTIESVQPSTLLFTPELRP